jgi:inorganic pyrophosphatase/exopolyphosphatase
LGLLWKLAPIPTVTPKKFIQQLKERGLDINKFKVKLLKMDCKGCEWDVVNNEIETLKLINIIKIKYSGHPRSFTYKELVGGRTLGYK